MEINDLNQQDFRQMRAFPHADPRQAARRHLAAVAI
jgi:hypothetical protein